MPIILRRHYAFNFLSKSLEIAIVYRYFIFGWLSNTQSDYIQSVYIQWSLYGWPMASRLISQYIFICRIWYSKLLCMNLLVLNPVFPVKLYVNVKGCCRHKFFILLCIIKHIRGTVEYIQKKLRSPRFQNSLKSCKIG